MATIGKKSRRWIGWLGILMMICFMLSLDVKAEEEQATLSLDDASLQVGTSTTLTLTLTNVKSGKIVGIEGIDAFEIMSNSQSQSTSIINGKTTQETKVSYMIMPKEEGTFTLKATVELNGSTVTTNALTVTVEPRDTSLDENAEDVFVKTTVEEGPYYIGQNVVVTYDLYSKYNVENFSFSENPTFEGFITNTMGDGTYSKSLLTIGGEQYVKYTVYQAVLSPTKTGDFEIPGYQFGVTLGTGSLFSTGKTVYTMTDAFTIEVLPLPEEDRPDNFSGLVGEFTAESIYDHSEVAYGDPVTLKVTIHGNSSLDSLSTLGLEEQAKDFSVYETSGDLKESVSKDVYSAEKSFEIILVPKDTGTLTIDGLSIPYFNTGTGGYDSLTIDGKDINVTGSKPIVEGGSSTLEAAPLIVSQTNYIAGESGYFTLRIKEERVHQLVILILVLLLMSAVLWIYIKWFKSNRRVGDASKDIRKAKDKAALYRAFCRALSQKTGYDPRSYEEAIFRDAVKDDEAAWNIASLLRQLEGQSHVDIKKMKKDCLNALKAMA